MELFREDGCMTDAGFRAMMDGQLDELGRLEAAEHLSYCDQCMDRYTALLTADALETPPKSMQGAVMGTIWARLMQNTYGRAAVAGVAAVLALTLWERGAAADHPVWCRAGDRAGDRPEPALGTRPERPGPGEHPAIPPHRGRPAAGRAGTAGETHGDKTGPPLCRRKLLFASQAVHGCDR